MTPHQLGTSRISKTRESNYRDYIVFIFYHFTTVYSIFYILFKLQTDIVLIVLVCVSKFVL
jgi:hypothetical protein